MRLVGKGMLTLVVVLAFHTAAAAQTLTAALTDPTAKGKDEGQVLGTATFTLEGGKDVMTFSIVFKSALIAGRQVSINLGTPTQPGPAIFVLADGESPSPIQGSLRRGAETPQPDSGIHDWDDAINAMLQNNTLLKMESPNYPIAGLTGTIKRN